MRPRCEAQPYGLHSRTFIMDCRVKPGNDGEVSAKQKLSGALSAA
jgi:hypothetical protein